MPQPLTINQLTPNPNPELTDVIHSQKGEVDHKTTLTQILNLLSPSQVKSLLETLTADNRLDGAAVKNINAQITAESNTVLARASSTPGVISEVALNPSELLGRGSSGNISPITVGAGLNISGSTLSASGGGTSGFSPVVVIANGTANSTVSSTGNINIGGLQEVLDTALIYGNFAPGWFSIGTTGAYFVSMTAFTSNGQAITLRFKDQASNVILNSTIHTAGQAVLSGVAVLTGGSRYIFDFQCASTGGTVSVSSNFLFRLS